MNKEMKFKAWDKKNKCWLTDKENVYLSEEGEAFILVRGAASDYLSRVDVDVIFYIGLKDKNGKEIYEADILEFKNDLGRHHKYTVFSVDGGLAINTHKSDLGKETQFYDACADMQTAQWIRQCAVIGNIYENADLLQDVA